MAAKSTSETTGDGTAETTLAVGSLLVLLILITILVGSAIQVSMFGVLLRLGIESLLLLLITPLWLLMMVLFLVVGSGLLLLLLLPWVWVVPLLAVLLVAVLALWLLIILIVLIGHVDWYWEKCVTRYC